MSPRALAVDRARLAQWCMEHLGSPPAGEIFRSGYLSAVLHYLVTDLDSDASDTVVGIDHIPELVDWSKTNLQRDGLGVALESGHLKMIVGDGRQGE